MAVLIISPNRDPKNWIQALKQEDPDLELEIYPAIHDPEAVEFALSWKHPHQVFQQFPNLKVIASMGAGVDHILSDKNLPDKVTLTRVVDDQLTRDMSIFVLGLVLDHTRNLSRHYCSESWEPLPYRKPSETRVGIMGLGVLGTAAADQLRKNGFCVSGWSATKKNLPEIQTFHGQDQLNDFLKTSEILVCLLPLTAATQNILNRDLFRQLPKGAYLINVARGSHLVEEDLLEMIRTGQLSGASLDVFRKEPLPEEHPFWECPEIRITPHIASVTDPTSVAPQILENYRRMKEGKALKHQVSRENEY